MIVAVKVTVKVTVKMKDLGEGERMLPRMLLINSLMGPEDEMIVLLDL